MIDRAASPLECALIDEAIEIRIGAQTLSFAARQHPDLWDGRNGLDSPNIKVTDQHVFAQEVCRVLTREDHEDGSTLITRMLDAAIKYAVEQGCEGVDYRDLRDCAEHSNAVDEECHGLRLRATRAEAAVDALRALVPYNAWAYKEENDALRAEIERLRADAERYRWLRRYRPHHPVFVICSDQCLGGTILFDEGLDQQCDAALGADHAD